MVLRERKWNIMSYNTGFTNYITGRAVVGHVSVAHALIHFICITTCMRGLPSILQEPVFNASLKVFQYESHTDCTCSEEQLRRGDTCGAMWSVSIYNSFHRNQEGRRGTYLWLYWREFFSCRGEYIMDAVTGMRLSIKIPVFYLIPKTTLNSPHSLKLWNSLTDEVF